MQASNLLANLVHNMCNDLFNLHNVAQTLHSMCKLLHKLCKFTLFCRKFAIIWIYAFLCKILDPKLRSSKSFDNYHVCDNDDDNDDEKEYDDST